jgi:penicillin-binding protein 4B
MWRKRAMIVGCLFLIGMTLLVGRLIQIQLFETEHFSKHEINLLEESVSQRSQEIVIDTGRGGFLDRNGESLTHKQIPVLILFPFLKNTEWDAEEIASILKISTSALIKAVEEAKKPFVFGGSEPFPLTGRQMTEINQLQIPGVFAVPKKFERDHHPAEHLIGITGENEALLKSRYPDKRVSSKTSIGLTGLEKSFDEFILPDGEAKLIFHVDASGGPLFGVNVKYVEPANPFYPVNIRTTIDAELQEMAETLADKHGMKKGGLVLLDIEENSVLSIVSRPSINQKDPFNPKDGNVENLMMQQQITGSVFKTVVAAAAIENGLDDRNRVFDCSKKINGEVDQQFNYGQLNFDDSFAKSCNNTFATLAKELQKADPYLLEEYAQKLSFIGPSVWQGDIYHLTDFKQVPNEEAGRIFLNEDEKQDQNFVGLTGIGQNEVRATPLAVANMMATIARGGKKEMVRFVSAVEYKNGTTLLNFKENELPGDTISLKTAVKLQRLLHEVVMNEEGTGSRYRNLPYEVAGKSGTGETGKFIGNKQLYNKWFAGYFPYHNPKYALVVVNLDVQENEGGVSPIFADYVQSIYEYDR